MFMVLILFAAPARALPLTRTLYIVPSDVIDFSVSLDYLYTSRQITRERFSAGTGLWTGASLNVRFDLLGNGIITRDMPGDSLIEFMAFLDSLSSGDLRSAFCCALVLPTGPDAYSSGDYRGAALGNNEITMGPVLAYGFSNELTAFLNLFYTFRQGEHEGFYNGFSLYPAKSDTYKSVMGLNPFYGDSFLYYKRLADDYVTAALAVVYSSFSPCVLFAELRCSGNISSIGGGEVSAAESSGINLLLAGAGVKYFFMDSLFMQVWGTINPFMNNDGIRWQSGLLLSLIF